MSDGQEKRSSERIKRQFVVYYQESGKEGKREVSQIRDISEGGMFFTVSTDFPPGTMLDIELKIPISVMGISLKAKVIESKEVIKGVIYNTRVSFQEIDPASKSLLKDTVNFFINKIKKEGMK